MMRRQPISTLFPYTTLFRSALGGHHFGDHLAPGPSLVEVLDRKSTRLNSSHVSISYAVFCLKKKKCVRRGRCRAAAADQHEVGAGNLRQAIVAIKYAPAVLN